MDKVALERLRRIYRAWEAVETLSDEERFILEILADSEGRKCVRVEEAFDVSNRTAYRYIYGVIWKIQNIFGEKRV